MTSHLQVQKQKFSSRGGSLEEKFNQNNSLINQEISPTQSQKPLNEVYQFLKIDSSPDQINWKHFSDINNPIPKDIFSWYNYNGYNKVNKKNQYISKMEQPLFVDFWQTFQARHMVYFLTKQGLVKDGEQEKLKSLPYSEVLRYWEIYANASLNVSDLVFPKYLDLNSLTDINAVLTSYKNLKNIDQMMNEVQTKVTKLLNKCFNLTDKNKQLVYGTDFIIQDLYNVCYQAISNYNKREGLNPIKLKVDSLLSSTKLVGSIYINLFNNPSTKNVVDLDNLKPSTFTINSANPLFSEQIHPEIIDYVEKVRKLIKTRTQNVLSQYTKTNYNNPNLLKPKDYILSYYKQDDRTGELVLIKDEYEAAAYLEHGNLPYPPNNFRFELLVVIRPNNSDGTTLPKAIGTSAIMFINDSGFDGVTDQDPTYNPSGNDGTSEGGKNPPGGSNNGGENGPKNVGEWIMENRWIFAVILCGGLVIWFAIWAIRVKIKSRKGIF